MIISGFILFYIFSVLAAFHDWRSRGFNLTTQDLVVIVCFFWIVGWCLAIKNLFKWLWYKFFGNLNDKTLLDWTTKKPWM